MIRRVYRGDLIHLGEVDELRTALVDLFNPRTPRADCGRSTRHIRQVIAQMEIRIAVEFTLHYRSWLTLLKITMFDFSSPSIKRAHKPCSIDPFDRAGAARLAGMDRDRDRGTTTRDGATQGSPRECH